MEPLSKVNNKVDNSSRVETTTTNRLTHPGLTVTMGPGLYGSFLREAYRRRENCSR